MSYTTSQQSTLLFLLFLISLPHLLSGQLRVAGKVIDAHTQSALPYATVAQLSTLSGTTSDSDGNFDLTISSKQITDSIEISYIGYNSVRIGSANYSDNLQIELTPMAALLDAVIVRPLEANEYLRIVQRKRETNTTPYSFNTISHYEEKMQEDSKTIDHHEGIFKSWYESYRKGAKTEHQLSLYRHDDWEELDFMRKRAEKEKKKFIKKNPEKAKEFEEGKLFITDFGGPEGIQALNLYARSLLILDSTQHKHFEFTYLADSEYMGRALSVISYRSKGKVDDRKPTGTIYIEKESDAVVWIKEEGSLILPLIAKPILFALGISIKNIDYKMELKLRPLNGLWYPQFTHWDISFNIKKKHLFDKNETAKFKIKQELETSVISINDVTHIPDSKKFDAKQKMEDQVHPIPGLNW